MAEKKAQDYLKRLAEVTAKIEDPKVQAELREAQEKVEQAIKELKEARRIPWWRMFEPLGARP